MQVRGGSFAFGYGLSSSPLLSLASRDEMIGVQIPSSLDHQCYVMLSMKEVRGYPPRRRRIQRIFSALADGSPLQGTSLSKGKGFPCIYPQSGLVYPLAEGLLLTGKRSTRVNTTSWGGPMFSRLVSHDDAAYILDPDDLSQLDRAIARGQIQPAKVSARGNRFRLGDLIICRLALVLYGLGVDAQKADRYARAVLASRLAEHDSHMLGWVENEAQELFCLLADQQLCRIYLRSKDDGREVDVGAVRPVLFPAVLSEINVFRVIRPVIYRARQLVGRD